MLHGTSKAKSDKIIEEKYIHPSKKADEWLGTGAYFWENSSNAAFFWLNKKYQHAYQKAVIEVFIKVKYKEIFDLNNDSWRRLFDYALCSWKGW